MAPLKSFEAARQCIGAWNRRPVRVASIEVRQIVGSVDEAKRAALTPRFLPRRWGMQARRYRAILAAMCAGRALPAIEVYALGDEYYVVDGHHRVAAARALGQVYIDALVHEFLLPICRACSCGASTAAGLPVAPRGPWGTTIGRWARLRRSSRHESGQIE
jgi:hypothetical protein